MDFDPERLRRHLEAVSKEPSTIAEADQQQARLHENRDMAIWWAALVVLARERKNRVSHLLALRQLASNLAEIDFDDLVYLTAYLLCNTVSLAAEYDHGGDTPATVSAIIGPDKMLMFEKFVATDGRSCPVCGFDEGMSDHPCKGDEGEQG